MSEYDEKQDGHAPSSELLMQRSQRYVSPTIPRTGYYADLQMATYRYVVSRIIAVR